jgi:GNAT superfamily N-acetyltransferase
LHANGPAIGGVVLYPRETVETTVFVRAYLSSDQPQVRWLHDRTPPAGRIASAPQAWPPELDAILEHFLVFWVALEPDESDEHLVGMVGLERTDSGSGVPVPSFVDVSRRVARLDVMRVAPERQRLGIGRLLGRTAIEWARDRGYEAVILETTPQQEAAVALYKHLGFAEVGRTTYGRWRVVWFELPL